MPGRLYRALLYLALFSICAGNVSPAAGSSVPARAPSQTVAAAPAPVAAPPASTSSSVAVASNPVPHPEAPSPSIPAHATLAPPMRAAADVSNSVLVDARSNIFAAGQSQAGSAADDGLLPPSIPLPPGVGRVLTFANVAGTVSCCNGSPSNGPDGLADVNGTAIDSANGASGITHADKILFLVGVFLDDTTPSGSGPQILHFSSGGAAGTIRDNFTTLSPVLNQTFFIGDGKTGTGSGSIQQFQVPNGATRLFLGFADASALAGPPGDYADNTGSLLASYTITGGKLPLPPDQNQAPEKCPCQSAQPSTSQPVNTRTGNLWTSLTDLAVPGLGPDLSWTRTYNNRETSEITTSLGFGWQHPFAARLLLPNMPGGESGRVIVLSPKGNRLRFTGAGAGPYTAFPGVYDTLVHATGVYTQTLRDQQQWVFDESSGRLVRVRDSQGRQLNLTYSGTPPQLTQITDANDSTRKLVLSYTNGRITSVSDGTLPTPRTVQYTYDPLTGDLAQVGDLRGQVTRYSYKNHLLTTITNPLNQVVESMGYDASIASAKVITQTLQDGQKLQFQYLAASTVITSIGADGRRTVQEVAYASDNTMTGMLINRQSVLASGFDSSFSPATLTDGNNHTTSTTYSAVGLPSAQTNALGQTSRAFYDASNNITKTIDLQGVASLFRYDAYNNLISTTLGITTTSPLRATTLWRYQYRHANGTWDTNAAGATDSRLFEQTAPDGVITYYDYADAAHPRRVTKVTLGFGSTLAQATTYGYDGAGRVVTTTLGFSTPLARVGITSYNADNTIKRTIQNYKGSGSFNAARPDENITTSYGYDKLGRTIAITDTLGHVDVTHYDGQGRVDWTARNVTVPLQFDASGQPRYHAYSRLFPDRNVNTLYGYDGLGRTAFVTETGILTGTFNAATLQFSDVTTRTTRTEFDTLSRPVTVTLNYRAGLPSTADTNVKLYTRYDGASNVITQTDALGRLTVTNYDALNRPIAVIANYQDGNPLTGPADADIKTVTRYDLAGRVQQQIGNEENGQYATAQTDLDRITQYQYDMLSRVVTTTLNLAPGISGADLNRVSISRYDPITTRMLGTRDALGRWLSQQYDQLGRVSRTIQNCTGSSAPVSCGTASNDTNVPTSLLYDALGRTAIVSDALGFGTRSSYDGLGRTIKTVRNSRLDSNNGNYSAATPDVNVATSYQYDALGRTTIVTDVLGAATRYSYDGLGHATSVTDPLGRVTQNGYDGSGALRWTKRPDGQITVYQLDGLGRTVTTVVNYQDGVAGANEPPDQDLISRSDYDAAGRRVQATDPAGRVRLFVYDNLDRLTAVTENLVGRTCPQLPCNVQTQYRYDHAGNRTAIVDANSHTRTFRYNAADEQTDASDALGRMTSWLYDAGGRMTTKLDPRDRSRPVFDDDLTYSYDGLDRLSGISAGSSAALSPITMAYDAMGRRRNLADGSGTTEFSYDALGRITQSLVKLPQTSMTVGYGYDGRGARTKLTYPDGIFLTYAYQLDGRLQTLSQSGVSGPLASYAYDTLGRLIQVARTNSAITNYRYDKVDRLRELHTSEAGTTVGGFLYQTDRLGLRTAITETLPLSPTISSTRLKAATFEAASLTNPATGMTSLSGAPAPTLESSAALKGSFAARLPNAGNSFLRADFSAVDELFVSFYLRLNVLPASTARIALISNSGTTVGNLQITSSGVLQLRNGGTTLNGSNPTLQISRLYRLGLHQKKGTGANGVLEAYLATDDNAFGAPFATSATQTFTTPATQVQIGATTATAVNAVVDDIALDRAAMPPPSLSTPMRVVRYGYDGLLRLTSAVESPGSSFSYGYDLAGNRTSVTVNGQTATTSYDAADQIVGATYDAAGNLLQPSAQFFPSYSYDALNRLVGAVPSNQSVAYSYNGDGVLVAAQPQLNGLPHGTPTIYTQDLAAPLSQVLQTTVGSTTVAYRYGLERLASQGADGKKTWYTPDALGSVRRTLAEDGAPGGILNYDPWGTPEGGAAPPTFGFTGELHDPTTGLVNLRARWYSTNHATFLTRDRWPGSVQEPQTLSYYSYVHNDPINWTDPSGQWRWRATGSVYHELIEDDYMNIVMANPVDIQVEFDDIPGVVIDMINAAIGDVYEIEPALGPAVAFQGLVQAIGYVADLNLRGSFAPLIGGAPSLNGAVRPVPGQSYDYNAVVWHLGAMTRYPALRRIPLIPGGLIPVSGVGIADLVATSPFDGLILYWLEPHNAVPATVAAFNQWQINKRLKRRYGWAPWQPVPEEPEPLPPWYCNFPPLPLPPIYHFP